MSSFSELQINSQLLYSLPNSSNIISISKWPKYSQCFIVLYLQIIPGCCSVTTDFWKDQYKQNSYVSFTLHYIDTNWELKKKLLFTAIYSEIDARGATIERMLKTTAKGFNIDEVAFAKLNFCTDMGPNLINAFKNYNRYDCTAHALNLVLKTAFTQAKHPELHKIHDLLCNSKSVIEHVKRTRHIG